MGRVVLVTGAARHLGGQMTRALAKDPSVERVIGVDVVPLARPWARPSSSGPTFAIP